MFTGGITVPETVLKMGSRNGQVRCCFPSLLSVAVNRPMRSLVDHLHMEAEGGASGATAGIGDAWPSFCSGNSA